MEFLNLTESEKLEILSLHNNEKIIGEQNGDASPPSQAAPAQAQAPAASAQAPAAPAQAPAAQAQAAPAPVDRTSLINQIQTILTTKYKANLGKTGLKGDGIDGKLGPKTLQSISNLISPVKREYVAPVNSTIAPITTAQVSKSTPIPAETSDTQ